MKKYLFIIAIAVSMIMPSCRQSNVPSGQQNSQWRGENRDGMYLSETGLLKEWGADGPELLWYFEGLSDGHSSPAIANGRLYITGLNGDNLTLFVFDLKGQLLNKKELSQEWGRSNGGTRSTVCVNDGKLYVFSGLGKLYCLNAATLDVIWSKDLFTDFDGRNNAHGITESPLIVGDKLIMTPGGEVNNIIALNKNTGELIWSSPGEGTISAFCSPQFIGDQSVPMLVTSTFDYIIALNVDTGEKLWSFYRTSTWNNHPNTPLYHNGMIFSTTGDGAPAVMLRLKNGGRDFEVVWENPDLDTQMGGAVRVGDYIYASGHTNRFWFCVDWNTGETKYRVRDIGACNVIFADGMLYCYSERGTMNLVKPNPENFELVSSFSVELGTGTHWAHTVIHDGVLYIRHGDALMAYKVKLN